MNKIRFLTAGESHGQALVGILEGIPAGLEISSDMINFQLARRQHGFGRGGRMQIEKDKVQILSGVRFGKTLGSPIALLIKNLDWENWHAQMSVEKINGKFEPIRIPRPGHADLAGVLKYGYLDIRNVLERASARETAIKVALGAITTKLLAEFKIKILSHVIQMGNVATDFSLLNLLNQHLSAVDLNLEQIEQKIEQSELRCYSKNETTEMKKIIKQAQQQGETLGGIFEIGVFFLPVGLGSYTHWDRKLDGRITGALMSIPAIKSVEIGLGRKCAESAGSAVHDEIFYSAEKKLYRKTNNAGGIEGGMTNGEPVVVRCTMKPIPTLTKPLNSVNLETLEAVKAHKERSDVCAVPAAAVVGEATISLMLADAFCEKFGGDSMEELKNNFLSYKNSNRKLN